MLDTKDFQMLREMIGVMLTDQKIEIRDEIHSLIKASEARLMRHAAMMREEILDGVSTFIDDQLLPQIDNHERRIVRLERGGM
jgi:hypothetical protein